MRPPLLLCLAFSCLEVGLSARTWSDAAGRKLDAEFGGLAGDRVKLKLPDGREVDYPLAGLSAADQEFVRLQSAPRPEPVPATDYFPAFDFPVPAEPKRDATGRQVISWGPVRVSVPGELDTKRFQQVFRPTLGAFHILKQMGFPDAALPTAQSPVMISIRPSDLEVAKEAELKQPAHSLLTAAGRLVASSVFVGISSGEVTEAEDAGLSVEARIVRQSIRLHKDGWRPFLPGWLNAGIEEYARMLPWTDGWPQTSSARVAMKKLQAELAGEKSWLVAPALLDVLFKQPTAMIGTSKDDRPQRIAALMAVFYLRHVHGDGKGGDFKKALEGVVEKVAQWQRYRAEGVSYEEVWAAIKTDPRTIKQGGNSYRFSADHQVPEVPRPPFDAPEIQAACTACNDALCSILGANPGEAVIAGLQKAGFTQGVTLDKAEVAALSQKTASGGAGTYMPRDLTPDYANVRPTNPLPPLEQRTWPLMVVMGSNLSVPSIVKSDATSAIYKLGSFEFETGPDLSIALVREIARSFAGMEELFQRMPWGLPPIPPESSGHFTARLYPSTEDYNKIAPPLTGGFYSLKDKVFHVPYQSLGMAKDSKGRWSRARAFDPDTLVHELTHMMMDRVLPALPIWVAEGSAEYVETIPLSDGALKLSELPKAIKEYVGKMSAFPGKIGSSYILRPSAGRMVALLRTTHKRWDEIIRDGAFNVVPAGKIAEAEPKPEDNTTSGKDGRIGFKPVIKPLVTFIDPNRTKSQMAVQHDLYMHSCLLFYYFMHLDNSSRRGDPMIPYLEKAREFSEKIQLFLKAEAAYEEEFKTYRAAWERFASQPGVKRTGQDSISYPPHMVPPQAPTLPRPPIDIDKLPDKDISMSQIDLLIRGRTDEQLVKAFCEGFAKIGITLDPPF